MTIYIYPLIALAFATTLGYLLGKKKNKAIGIMIGESCEKVFQPESKEYVNIGGTMGHNFTYQLAPPYTEAKGTCTLLPRHSVLYFPLSLIISRHDRFYLNLFVGKDLLGEGHIICEKYFPRMRVDIAGMARLKRDTYEAGGKTFILLWDNPHLKKKLETLLDRCEGLEDLLHFCCYRENKTFFIHTIPRARTLSILLKGIYGNLKGMIKMGGADEGDA